MHSKYWATKHTIAQFLPWVPLCKQHLNVQLSKPLSPSAANLTRRQFCVDSNSSSPSLGTIPSAEETTKGLLFGLVKTNFPHYKMGHFSIRENLSSSDLRTERLSAIVPNNELTLTNNRDNCRAMCKLTSTLTDRQLITRFCELHFSPIQVTHENNSLRNRHLE